MVSGGLEVVDLEGGVGIVPLCWLLAEDEGALR
jgi:hypothetical protein